jgi:hypothetical protein
VSTNILGDEILEAFLEIQDYELVRPDRTGEHEIGLKRTNSNLESLIIKMHPADTVLITGVFYRALNIPFAPFIAEMEQIVSNVAELGEVQIEANFNMDPAALAVHYGHFDTMIAKHRRSLSIAV